MKKKTRMTLILLFVCVLLLGACGRKEEKDYFELIDRADSVAFEKQGGPQLEIYGGEMKNLAHFFRSWALDGNGWVPVNAEFVGEWLYRLDFNFTSPDAATQENGTRVEVLVGPQLVFVGDRVYQCGNGLTHEGLLEYLEEQFDYHRE